MKFNKNAVILGLATVAVSAGLAASSMSGVTLANNSPVDSTINNGRQAMHRETSPPIDLSKITRTVENTASGVIEKITSTDADIVTKLQSMPVPAGPRGKGTVTVTQTQIEGGIQREISSTDATEIALIQTNAQNKKFGMFGGERGERGKRMGMMNGVDMTKVNRSVTNLGNGVQVTMTSDDPAIVTKLQEFEKNRPHLRRGNDSVPEDAETADDATEQ